MPKMRARASAGANWGSRTLQGYPSTKQTDSDDRILIWRVPESPSLRVVRFAGGLREAAALPPRCHEYKPNETTYGR